VQPSTHRQGCHFPVITCDHIACVAAGPKHSWAAGGGSIRARALLAVLLNRPDLPSLMPPSRSSSPAGSDEGADNSDEVRSTRQLIVVADCSNVPTPLAATASIACKYSHECNRDTRVRLAELVGTAASPCSCQHRCAVLTQCAAAAAASGAWAGGAHRAAPAAAREPRARQHGARAAAEHTRELADGGHVVTGCGAGCRGARVQAALMLRLRLTARLVQCQRWQQPVACVRSRKRTAAGA
jgi:hypothetical protein